MESPLAVLSRIARALEERDITYVIVGSFASSMRGIYRSTADLDIVADIKLEQVRGLVEALRSEFYIDESDVRRAVSARSSFNAIHFDSVFKVDVFIPPANDFSEQQLARRQAEQIAPDLSQKIYVATSEDTILAKLRWYRLGNEISTTQWADIQGIIGAQGSNLDIEYLRAWAKELNVIDLLERALATQTNEKQ